MLRLYDDLAGWYTRLTAPEDYVEEAAFFAKLSSEAAPGIRSVLELGAGVGANASHLKARWELVLVDLSPAMLAESRKLNPELEHHLGDMRSVRLGRTFDAVFVHDAVSYMLTREDLEATVATCAAHLGPGGVVLLCPDDTAEDFAPGTDEGGHDAPDGSGVRYLAWSSAGPEHTAYTDYAYLLRAPDGSVEVVHERHVTGRLPMAMWLEVLDAAGFDARCVELEHSEVEAGSHHVFLGVMRGQAPRDLRRDATKDA